MSRESKILMAVLVVVVGGMIGLFALANGKSSSTGPSPTGDKTKIVRDSSHKTGSGPVQLVEFGDYQCPACGAAYPNVKQIMKDFDGKVTLYFRNFPLPMHANAPMAAQAAEAAGAQGKYWEMHDKLYENQKDWGELGASAAEDKVVGYAKDLGLDATKLKSDIDSEKYKSVVEQDKADGNALGIQGTPTFYLNGTQLQGGYDYPTLRDAVNKALGQG